MRLQLLFAAAALQLGGCMRAGVRLLGFRPRFWGQWELDNCRTLTQDPVAAQALLQTTNPWALMKKRNRDLRKRKQQLAAMAPAACLISIQTKHHALWK